MMELVSFVLLEEGEVLVASASIWSWGIPNLLNRFLPNAFGVSGLLLGTSAVSTSPPVSSHPLCQIYTY